MIPLQLHQAGKLNCYVQFPENWNELFPEEVLEISKLMLLYKEQNVAKGFILLFIIEFRARVQKLSLPAYWRDLLNAEDAVTAAYPLLDFLFAEVSLTEMPEKRIKLPRLIFRTVYGPENGFESLTCGEFEDTEHYFHKFLDEPNGEDLASIAAVLWRPKNTPYIKRVGHEYLPYKIDNRLKNFLKLQPWRLYAIFLWYAGNCKMLPELFPLVHEKHADNNKQETQEPDPMAFTKCIHAGAGPKNGSRSDIRMMKLFEYFFDMEQEAQKARDMKAMYDEQASGIK